MHEPGVLCMSSLPLCRGAGWGGAARRAGDRWFLCDDAWLGGCQAADVARAQAFQLFYMRGDLLDRRQP